MSPIDLNELAVFVRVAARRSFSRAARDLGVPSSTVSRKIASLESRLGVQLVERSTRHVRVTALGAVYQSYCERALAAAEEGERTLRQLEESPRGALRVTAPHAFGELALRPIVERYVKLFPEVSFELWLTDDVIDLAAQGIDVAFRFGSAPGASVVARVFGVATSVVCASPGYLSAREPPRAVADLAAHPLLLFGRARSPHVLRFEQGGEPVQVAVTPRVAINNYPVLRSLCAQGHGVAILPAFYADDDLAHGRLVRVLTDAEVPAAKIMVVRPDGVKPTKTVRAFLDLVREHHDKHGWAPPRA
jgi:DNA-binding transcriptional LysR family regulator